MEHARTPSGGQAEPTITLGRYVLHREIARGGMATIHFGRLLGDEGFSRIVAVKRLHAELAQDPQFVSMFLSEARLASRVQHRNVVPVLDVAVVDQELILVQEYVHGVPLDLLLANTRQSEQRLPVDLAIAIACQLLAGLHAIHETTDELGQPMHIVHRDVSPQNVMVALDGSARLLDFGIATAGVAAQVTSERIYKGKLAYSAPEQLLRAASAQSDIYAASVLLWELLVGGRMHGSKAGAELVSAVLRGALPGIQEALVAAGRWHALSEAERAQLEALEPIVRKGLCLSTSERWASAREMEEALASCVQPAPARVLAEWARTVGAPFLTLRARILATEEERWRRLHPLDATRASDPGSQATPRSMRASIPPDSPAAAPPSVKRSRAREIALVSAGSVAVAIALLSSSSPTIPSEAKPLGKLSAPVPAQPAASRVPESAPTTEQAVQAPLSLPRREAVAETRSAPRELAEPPQITRSAPLPQASDGAQLRTLPASRPAAVPKDIAAPAIGPELQQDDDCDVPYYFEGKKKIFKHACI